MNSTKPHILITRPLLEAQHTARQLAQMGYTTSLAPLTMLQTFDITLPNSDGFDAIALSSPRALSFAANAPMPPSWLEKPIFTVGDTSATAARNAGFTDVQSAKGNAISLSEILIAAAPKNLLYLCGEIKSADLAGLLRPHQITCKDLPTYAMQEMDMPADTATMLRNGTIDAVLHFSKRAAMLFSQQCPHQIAAQHFCLSTQVAEGLASTHRANAKTAEHPTHDTLLSTLTHHLPPS